MEVGEEDREKFRQAVARALEGAGRTQADVGRALGVERQAFNQWIAGGDPPRHRVFQIEEELDLPPGTLSKILGYLPLNAKAIKTVAAAIEADPALTPEGRRIVQAAYRAAIQT